MAASRFPTLGDHFKAHLERPEVKAELASLKERFRPEAAGTNVPAPLVAIAKVLALASAAGTVLATMIRRVEESSPSTGYEPSLAGQGSNPTLARGRAMLIKHSGKRRANDYARLPAIVGAIRFLAKPHRNKKAVAARIKVLLAAWEETSAFDMIFADTPFDEFEFVHRLEAVARGEERAGGRLREIAAALVPYLRDPRGRRVSLESATHEAFLELGAVQSKSAGYTWSPFKEDFSDSATEATRREFDLPDFDPRPAYRRVKAGRKRNPN